MAKATRKPFEVTPKGMTLDELGVARARGWGGGLAAR